MCRNIGLPGAGLEWVRTAEPPPSVADYLLSAFRTLSVMSTRGLK